MKQLEAQRNNLKAKLAKPNLQDQQVLEQGKYVSWKYTNIFLFLILVIYCYCLLLYIFQKKIEVVQRTNKNTVGL